MIVAALAATGCSGGGTPDEDKAGGSGRPITLRIGTDDFPGRFPALAIEEFARQAEGRSDGQIRVTPVWRAAGENVDDWDQAVADLVMDGELEMGLIPARAWDALGVMSLRALNAPFLLTSDEQVGAVVTDDDLAGDMMAGLDGVGIQGLALVPEELRHPFGFAKPLLGPEDYVGATIRASRSDTVYALLAALGANPDDLEGGFWTRDDVAGIESGFTLTPDSLPSTAAGNVTLFPKVESLVVNREVFAGLTDDQQATLRAAAEATRDWAVAAGSDDAGDAQTYCQLGGRVVWASDAQVEALERAAAPVYDQLEADPGTRSTIAAIRRATRRMPAPTPPAPCDPPTQPVVNVPPPEGVTYEGGVLRAELDSEDLVDQGVPPGFAASWDGVVTITIKDGRWSLEFAGKEGLDCEGPYEVYEGRVRFIAAGTCGSTADGEVALDAAWTVDADGRQVLSDFRRGPGIPYPEMEVILGGQQWERIG
jgi:TRAP-type C4-dicarboxylate transport system substrate-binding protein